MATRSSLGNKLSSVSLLKRLYMFVISTDLVLNFVDKVVVVVDAAAADDADDDGGDGDVECRDDDDDDSGGGILVDDCIDGESCCKTLVPDGDVIGVDGDVIEGFDDNMKWVDDDGDDDVDDGGEDVFKVEDADDGDSGATSNLDVGRILSEIAWSILLLSK